MNTNTTQLNYLQWKLIDLCKRKGLSVEQTFAELKDQRTLCQKMIEHSDEAFARKVFKKSTMTVSSYGASQRTSREDVISQLKSFDDGFIYGLTNSEITMLTNMVYWSLDTAVPSAMNFLKYFKKLLAFALKHKDVVQFRNPMNNFPVVLRVADEESVGISYKVHGRVLKSRINRKLSTTNKTKTVSSSVPGIIHSMDAAILHLIKSGFMDKPMAYIHDSVACHPNDIGKLKSAVTDSLTVASYVNYFDSIRDQLLDGIDPKLIPDELLVTPTENTWDSWEEDIPVAIWAYM